MTKKTHKAFTFLEVMLYVALASVVAGVLFSFGWNIISVRTKSATVRDTLAGARMVDDRLVRSIRSATGIDDDNSTFDEIGGKLALEGSEGPIVIDSGGDRITIKRGGAGAELLHSDDVRVRNLRFFKEESGEGEDVFVGFSFTAESYYPDAGGRSEYQYSVSWRGGAEIRAQ